MLLSLCYLLVRCVLGLAVWRWRPNDHQELEIAVLRHELAILRRQTKRPVMTTQERLFLAAASRFLPKAHWRSFIITPATLLRWHRRLVAKRWTCARRTGRPALRREILELVLRLARDNPQWGYQRIVGELKGLGVAVSATTVRGWLRQSGLGPAGTRRDMTWREFVRSHRHRCSRSIYSRWKRSGCNGSTCCSFIELGSRRVHLAECTPNPSAPWVIQQARQLTWTLRGRAEPMRFLIRDRDQKFTSGFDDVFRNEDVEIVRTPFRAPQTNGVAERFVRTVREGCLDWLLILNEQHSERVLAVFVDHYNGHRPHRALSLAPPCPARRSAAPIVWGKTRVLRRDRLGGVIHEYVRAA